MKLAVLIPARGGSKSIPRKNLATVGGISLVARAVLTARHFIHREGLSDVYVLVDTDDPEIAAEGTRWGAQVPFLRPPHLAHDTTQTVDNVLEAVKRLSEREGSVESVLLLQPTSPLRTARHVSDCWHAFDPVRSPSVVSVAAAEHPIEQALRMDDDGLVSWAVGDPGSWRRQDHARSFSTNGAVYVTTVAELERNQAFVVAGVTRGVVMPAAASLDVDTAEDLAAAEALSRLAQPRLSWSSAGACCPILLELPAPTAGVTATALSGFSRDVEAAGTDGCLLTGVSREALPALVAAGGTSLKPFVPLLSEAPNSAVPATSHVPALAVDGERVDPSAEARWQDVGLPLVLLTTTTSPIELLECVEAMPSAVRDAATLLVHGRGADLDPESLARQLRELRDAVGRPVGYRSAPGEGDHALAAVAAGADLITVPSLPAVDGLTRSLRAVGRAQSQTGGRHP